MVNFSKNWNKKLDCDIFTTIRKHIPAKEVYYRKKIGAVTRVTLNKELKVNARLLQVDVRKLKDIDAILLMLDTGSEDYATIFKKFGLGLDDDVLLMVYKKEGEEVGESL